MPILSAHVTYHQALGLFLPSFVSEHVPLPSALSLAANAGREGAGGEVVPFVPAEPRTNGPLHLAARRSEGGGA